MRIRCIVLVGLVGLSPLAEAKDRSVAPGQVFSGSVITVRAPNSENWMMLESSRDALVFARSGAGKAESFIAAVLRFELPDGQSKDEFVAQVKHDAEQDSPPDRFRNLEATFEYSEQRGYPCVLYKGSGEDMKAKVSFFSSSHLMLQVQSLYCRPPNMDKAGFAATYSHRGATKIDGFEAQATEFIDGVQIPQG